MFEGENQREETLQKEEGPQCVACVKAGWACPGYSRRWRFVDEMDGLKKLYSKKRYIFDEQCNDHWKSTWDGQEIVLWDMQLNTIGAHNAAMFIYFLENPRTQAAFPLAYHGSFYRHIPSRLGHNMALDSGISCLCSIFIERLTGQNTTTAILEEYVKSLRRLRRMLNDSKSNQDAETLCASIILQLCELLINTDFGRWIDLCQGSKHLIQQWGPDRFRDPFEREMLESQGGFIVSLRKGPHFPA
ncbi:hypothetical protein Asppvi_005770 [Aspergillus pseudoviridinutans]|uniref:Uncharacterized protein n=1 Tax=Aspergillus pseudoviridinutans TaxID=1517512 RepID=A0A9P3EUQ4_9EURO|nr:uncharacterized protein Asppvi_005770 [Aspergillus pseudoviridinutans]GIJ86872.1 hypothetical protein Asppvi_005770 [Aspergillus pseudoviridinutans]